MNISVIIPTYKRPEKLTKCLDAIASQTYPAYEVIIIYRDDDLDSLDIIQNYKAHIPLTLKAVSIPGVIHAENMGIQIAKGEILSFIDDDGYAPTNWCENIVCHFKKNENLIALGGPDNIIGDEHLRKFKSHFGVITWYGKLIGNHHHRGKGVHESQVLKGVNMSVRRSIMPLLDERLNSERFKGNGCHWELDVFLNIRKRNPSGLILFDTSLEVQHESQHSQIIIDQNHRNNARNMTYVYLKHFPLWKITLHFAYLIICGHERIPGLLKIFVWLFNKEKMKYLKFKAAWSGVIEGIQLYSESKR